MRTIRTVPELRAHLSSVHGTVGLVPTMGAFHAGHASLIEAARRDTDHVVVSLFVNPAQFNDPRDLEAYPRDEQGDVDIADELGADVLFAPAPAEVYPAGFATTRAGRRPLRRPGGRQAGRRPLRRRLHRRREAVQHGPAGRRLLRPEGRPAGRGPAPHGQGPRLPAHARRPARRSASPTASRSPAATSASARASAPRPSASPARCAPPPRAAWPAGRAVLAEYGIEPEYFAMVDPDTFEEPGRPRSSSPPPSAAPV